MCNIITYSDLFMKWGKEQSIKEVIGVVRRGGHIVFFGWGLS